MFCPACGKEIKEKPTSVAPIQAIGCEECGGEFMVSRMNMLPKTSDGKPVMASTPDGGVVIDHFISVGVAPFAGQCCKRYIDTQRDHDPNCPERVD